MQNQIQDHSEERREEEEKGTHLHVGYLVPSEKVMGELEFRQLIESQKSHLKVYYDLKNKFNLEQNSDTIVAEVKGLEGYHLLELLYKNGKTNSMFYIDAFDATIYDVSKLLTSTPAFEVAMEHIGYQISYNKRDMKVALDKMNSKEMGIVKRK